LTGTPVRREEKCQGKSVHPNGAGQTEKALPSAGQGSFQRLESGDSVERGYGPSPDSRFRNALSVRTDA